MFKFFDTLIKPIIDAIEPKIAVEIGAFTGANSRNIRRALSPDAEFHIVDPSPLFHTDAIGGNTFLHRDASLAVLPALPSFDMGIIDGDHNWYTIHHELKLIEKKHRDGIFPFLVFHDTAWPYGRRDTYFNPELIPSAYRHPYATRGMVFGESDLADNGFNRKMMNARCEGSPQNGVLTGIEDFLSESGRKFVFRTLPVYFGFGFLLSEDRIKKQPESLRALDFIFSGPNLISVLEQLEKVSISQHQRCDRLNCQLELSERFQPPPAAAEVNTRGPKLSIIVVVHNMRREAERTLHSLTKAYQKGIEGFDYEVIVVENGSTAPLDRETVKSLGGYFRYVAIHGAPLSPALAINHGAKMAAGEFLGIMIDGAHILTPGVLHYANRAFCQYEEPVVVLKYWFVGPGQQNQTVEKGYDRELEDQLFDASGWPGNGYELFNMGEMIGDKNKWLEPFFESNCLIMRKRIFDAIGGANEAFSSPGGGFLNADLYKEAAELAGTQVVAIIGEASFHQTHGGITTNCSCKERDRLVERYRDEYSAVRGREYRLPKVAIQYIGHFPVEAAQPGKRTLPLREKFK